MDLKTTTNKLLLIFISALFAGLLTFLILTLLQIAPWRAAVASAVFVAVVLFIRLIFYPEKKLDDENYSIKYYFATEIIMVIGIIALFVIITIIKAPEPQINTKTSPMTFFITSKNPGNGANIGGLTGADNYCQTLATSVNAGDRIWRAYLSTQAAAGEGAVNARDRIGQGPWKNFKGEIIAENLKQLHNGNNITKQTALDEKGAPINGRGDTPNWHDILTGSLPDGRAFATSTDVTCGNWTKNQELGSAMVGHHDRQGLRDDASSKSWNSSHFSRGCSLEALAITGSGGLIYCFVKTK